MRNAASPLLASTPSATAVTRFALGLSPLPLGLARRPSVVRKQTGHKSDRMLEHYIREESLFYNNVAAMLGL